MVKDVKKEDSSSECANSGRVATGHYGFIYVDPGVVKRLRKYLGREAWKDVGSVSLVVKPGGQYFQVTNFRFIRTTLIPISKIVDI